MQDRRIICVDCEREFILQAGEQEWYEKKGYPEPKRCPVCRKIKRAFFNDIKEAK